jgi:hypothetical protein
MAIFHQLPERGNHDRPTTAGDEKIDYQYRLHLNRFLVQQIGLVLPLLDRLDGGIDQ